jgi:tRNA wybutosine-synthesizing protein 1
VEVKGYMYLGYSRNRLLREQMPEHAEIREFSEMVSQHSDYFIKDESPLPALSAWREMYEI